MERSNNLIRRKVFKSNRGNISRDVAFKFSEFDYIRNLFNGMNVIATSNGSTAVKSIISMLPGSILSLRHFNIIKSKQFDSGVGKSNVKVNGTHKSAIALSLILSPTLFTKVCDEKTYDINVTSKFYCFKHVKPRDLKGKALTSYSFVSYVHPNGEHLIGRVSELFADVEVMLTYAVVSVLSCSSQFDSFDCPIYVLTDEEVVIPAKDILSVVSMNHNCSESCNFVFVSDHRPDRLCAKGDLKMYKLHHDPNIQEYVLNVYRW